MHKLKFDKTHHYKTAYYEIPVRMNLKSNRQSRSFPYHRIGFKNTSRLLPHDSYRDSFYLTIAMGQLLPIPYSPLKLSTGLAIAAFTD